MKKIFIPLILLCTYIITSCQAPPWTWAKGSTGGSGSDAFQVGTDAMGNVYIAGNYSGSITWGAFTLTGGSIYVAKLDTSGNVLWAKSTSGNTTAGVYGMTTDASGNTYVGGYFNSNSIIFGGYTLYSTAEWHSYLVKYDSSGNVAWAIDAGGNGNQVQAVAVNPAGNVFICGIYQNTTCTIGNTTLQSDGDNDSYIAKLDANGSGLWLKRVAGSSWDDVYGIAADASGNSYISGYSGSPVLTFGGTISLQNTAYALFIGKFDANGNAVWANNTTGTGYNFNATMAVDCNGNSYLTGYVDGTTNFGNSVSLSSSNGAEYFLTKYNASGTADWAETIAGASGSMGNDVATDAAGNIYTAGYFEGASVTLGATNLTSTQSQTSFLAKYDPMGNVSFAVNPVGNSNDDGYGVAVDATGNILLSGSFSSTSLKFGNTTLNSNGSGNSFVARIDAQIGAISRPTITANSATTFCQGDSVVLTSSVGNNYFWNDSATTQSITVKNSGSYVVMVSGGSTCFATSLPTVVSVLPPAQAGTIKGPGSICAGSSINLMDSASVAQNWQWQSSLSISNFTNINNATDSAYSSPVEQTTYYRVYTGTGGCSDTSAIFQLIVNPLPVPVISTNDSLICSYDSAFINSSGSYSSYYWNNGGTLPYTYADITGGYWLRVTDANGCTAISNHQGILVYPAVNPPLISATDSAFCPYDSTELSANGNYNSYRWNNGDTLSYVYTKTTGKYWLTVTDANGCTATSNQQGILAYPAVTPPLISATDYVFCPSDSTELLVNANYASYTWSNGDTLPYNYVNVPDYYQLTVTDVNGCSAVSNPLNVSLYPLPSVSIEARGDTLMSTGASAYQWLLNDTNLTGATSSVYVARLSGNYAVQVTDSNGCQAVSTQHYVTVAGLGRTAESNEINIYPNPFSNTVFIQANDIRGIEVYDVTGRIVFNESDVTTGYRIELNLSDLNQGVYYLKIKTGNADFFKPIMKQ